MWDGGYRIDEREQMVVNRRCMVPGKAPGKLRHLECDRESDFPGRIIVGELAISWQSILWRVFGN